MKIKPSTHAGGHKVRYMLVALTLVCCQMAPAQAEAGVDVSIGFNIPVYPNLVPIPGYPVYYDPAANSNYFFYDGLYWVYQDDNWYTSSWYNGPWELTDPDDVPLFVLRVPVRYYRQPPIYFRGWVADRPPHWGEHWGNDWRERHNGWSHWDHNNAPHTAPLPSYQRQYSGERYPHVEDQQRAIRTQNYHYQPREQATQQHFQQPAPQSQFKPIGQQVQIVPPQPQQRQQQRPQQEQRPQAQPQQQQRPQQEHRPQAQPQQRPQQQPQLQAQPVRPMQAAPQRPQGNGDSHGQDRQDAGHGDDHQGQGHDQGPGRGDDRH